MLFRDWRVSRGLNQTETGRLLGIEGVNPGGTLRRLEDGSRPADADMVERIVALTEGAVTAGDMHAVRLAWLKEHRPEKFAEGPRSDADPLSVGFADTSPPKGGEEIPREAAE